ncbi:hypothetical protein [Parvularcula mediterranea]|nr:hypothetical protein [Parvularcula mediterranea]
MNRHRFVWVILAPVMAVTIAGALMVKPGEGSGSSENLPAFLTEGR